MADPDNGDPSPLSEVGCNAEQQKEERQQLPEESNAVKLLNSMQALFTQAYELSKMKTASSNSNPSTIQLIPFNPDDPEADIEGWCRVTEIIVHKKCLEGVDLLVALTGALKGRAATCITKFNLNELSWDVIKQTLRAKFSKPKLLQDYFDEILRFQISSKETASEGALRLWNMIESIPKTEMQEEVITGFVISVLSQKDSLIRRELNAHAITTRAQLFRILGGVSLKRRIEGPDVQESDPKRARWSENTRFPGKCHWCGLPGHRVADCKKKREDCGSSRSAQQNATSSAHVLERGQTTCYACGKAGHLATTCPDRKSGAVSRKEVNICEQRLSRGILRTSSGPQLESPGDGRKSVRP
ncbi:uncharacterized protein LOC123661440 [Melitaea cinxia]|uniref:uncharacterized protein LOC123661440 n=2 Tax=Melitaea cinxia TaxID=113334 RepID=UPI001E2719E4|nr:uncharacterized protein LOC123661440 [Melitaea cinxia]